MNRLIICLIFLCLPYCLFSQGIWKTYTRDDGLVGDTVSCIAQDKIGNLWFGTWYNGISMLDTNGVWTNFVNTDSTVSIYDIEIDSLNNKWLALAQRGGHFNGTYVVTFDDSSYTYYDPTEGAMFNPTCLGQDSAGHIWCGTNLYGMAFEFDGVNWYDYIVPGTGIYSMVSDIKIDRKGTLFFAHERGISTIDDILLLGWWTLDIAFDKQNRMWFTTHSTTWGLGMFDGENWFAYTENDGLLEYYLNAVAVDSNNNIWISYGNWLGVSKFDGKQFYHFNQEHGLAHDKVRDIYVDRKGDIWFATRGGVSVLTDTTTGVKYSNKQNKIKKTFSLLQNYPNPFNSSTIFRYILPQYSKITLTIFNLKGEEVKTLVDDKQPAGSYQILWDGKDNFGKEVSSSIYIAVLKNDDFRRTTKLTLIR